MSDDVSIAYSTLFLDLPQARAVVSALRTVMSDIDPVHDVKATVFQFTNAS